MATNVFFSPKVRTEQYLYEDIIIEALRTYGQDVYYIPRETVTPDEILNEEYSKYSSAYIIEMYIATNDSFEGEGDILSKFGLEIRDRATFVVARRRFQQLVQIDTNSIREERPREGDLIYLPLSKSLFEIKFVEHEKPFYQLSNLPTYELQCELFEYSAEKFNTGVNAVDRFEQIFGPQTVIQVTGGTYGFKPGERIKQIVSAATQNTAEVAIIGEVSNFVETQALTPNISERQANLYITGVQCTNGSLRTFFTSTTSAIVSLDNPTANIGWRITDVYGINDKGKYIPQEPLSQNDVFENTANDIIDFSESNPFGSPGGI